MWCSLPQRRILLAQRFWERASTALSGTTTNSISSLLRGTWNRLLTPARPEWPGWPVCVRWEVGRHMSQCHCGTLIWVNYIFITFHPKNIYFWQWGYVVSTVAGQIKPDWPNSIFLPSALLSSHLPSSLCWNEPPHISPPLYLHYARLHTRCRNLRGSGKQVRSLTGWLTELGESSK